MSNSTKADYPRISFRGYKIPTELDGALKVKGDSLLMHNERYLTENNEVKFWVRWSDKRCIKCNSPWMLHIVAVPGTIEDGEWVHMMPIPTGAFPTCNCAENVTPYNKIARKPESTPAKQTENAPF